MAIAQATFEQADATLKQVQAGFDAGTQPEFEVLRARVSRDNQAPVLIRQRLNRELTLLRLKQLLDLPAAYDLQLADSLRDDSLELPAVFAARVAPVERIMASADTRAVIVQALSAPLPRRAAVDTAAADVRRTEAALSLAEAQRKPSVTRELDLQPSRLSSGCRPALGDLRTNWTVGATVEVPILTGGRQRGDELAARSDVEQSRARLQQVEELAGLDTRLAWAELLAARATWEASAGTVQQAARAHEIADVRYRRRRLDATRAVGRTSAPTAGGSHARAGGPRRSGGPRAGGAPARSAARQYGRGHGHGRWNGAIRAVDSSADSSAGAAGPRRRHPGDERARRTDTTTGG